MDTYSLIVHLETGEVRTEYEAPVGLEDDEVLAHIERYIHARGETPYRRLGGLLFRVEAFRAVELA